MESVRPCGCKGIRSCLICEEKYDIARPDFGAALKDYPSYVYCHDCDKCWLGWDAVDVCKRHPTHLGNCMQFPGVYIKRDFLVEEECSSLMYALNELPWESSQSGRRKQNFGPKCNFKKQKLRLGDFEGFPKATKFIQQRFNEIEMMKNFQTIEQCTLEYDNKRGAAIDPHIDDCWVWGERVVTVNVLGKSVLTMTPYNGSTRRYNLEHMKEYNPRILKEFSSQEEEIRGMQQVVIRIPMPARSLVVLFGPARYLWEHCVLREDVTSKRVCLAYREFTPPLLNTTSNKDVGEILAKAKCFW